MIDWFFLKRNKPIGVFRFFLNGKICSNRFKLSFDDFHERLELNWFDLVRHTSIQWFNTLWKSNSFMRPPFFYMCFLVSVFIGVMSFRLKKKKKNNWCIFFDRNFCLSIFLMISLSYQLRIIRFFCNSFSIILLNKFAWILRYCTSVWLW